jgi:hypothetical protein
VAPRAAAIITGVPRRADRPPHQPSCRALCRTEYDVLTALPRLLARRAAARPQAGASYARGTFGLPLALALTPVLVAEAVVVHLLLPVAWLGWASTGAHAYLLLLLWGVLLGPGAYPHRLLRDGAELRAGALYRARVGSGAVVSTVRRRERVGASAGGLVERDDAVLLPVRGRVDLWLELAEPVPVHRPFGPVLWTRRLAIASDDPGALQAALAAPPGA